MPRNLRAIEAGVAYHVTQRGVDRQAVFFSGADRTTYLQLLEANLADARVSVLAYCLMTNHVHWVVVPEREDSLAVLFRRVHGRYAQYVNARRGRTGHLWQNRYFSCAVARGHLWSALRYVEMNPVRAGMVQDPAGHRWSSAGAHLAGPQAAVASHAGVTLDWSVWELAGGAEGWRELLGQVEALLEVIELRRCTYSGRPYGSAEFVGQMEAKFHRHWRSRGRPRKSADTGKGADCSAFFSAS